MKRSDLLRLRRQTAEKIAAIMKEPGFEPENYRQQRRGFHALCAAHRVLCDELAVLNDRPIGERRVTNLTRVMQWLEHGINEDACASRHFSTAKDELQAIIDAFPTD